MGLLSALGIAALAGLVGLGIKSQDDEAKEEAKRQECLFCFPSTIPEEKFEEIAMGAAKLLRKKILLK